MLGAGASATSRSARFGLGARGLTFGLETQEEPAEPLRFYDKLNNCDISCDVDREENTQPGLRSVRSCGEGKVYSSGTGRFTGFEDHKGKSILAKYEDGSIAGLAVDAGAGKIALWTASIEYPLTEEPASSIPTSQDTTASEKLRKELLQTSLLQLGLQSPPDEDNKLSILRPLPQFLTSTPSKRTIVSQITNAIAAPQLGSQLSVLKDANDEFLFHALQEGMGLMTTAREDAKSSSDPSTWQPKHIIVCQDGELPSRELTPLFDLALFYSTLAEARKREDLLSTEPWGTGEAVLYGEAVTSTQTMLDKNPVLLSQLPTPLLSLASYQLAGRGRGSNVWLSPSGCLQFSILQRVSLSGPAAFPPAKIVFVQYLFALAVVEACRDEAVLGPRVGERIRVKWPNDLYAQVSDDGEVRKVGGVLVNTSFSGGKVDIVIGCGLNVLNQPPITSLAQLHPGAKEKLSIEKTAAVIMAKFESMWNVFLRECSFEPLLDLYLKRWLHSDQVVTLTTTTPHIKVRITGITLDYGLLRTIPERTGLGRGASEGEFIDLQPDGNSFDLMANLIKLKS
ncbi:unnamed protein product [Cyclocybe aegerita]|uniref:BPL/LPL catalytic domain-containing protein n=1 Tax=Cyclocybe aegerita TaxID=1973307 RepID=A0A8S0WDT1_CYCAE|nr:unnamed protein product [Cyclocybe aegerita]